LHTLRELGITRIDLKFRFDRYVDKFGNEFRYVSKYWDSDLNGHDFSYDVVLQAWETERAVGPK